VRIGLVLPTFTLDGSRPITTARLAEAAGLDGVFVFDHLWPVGQPGRPALSAVPVLGAVAAATRSVVVGSLVARVGLLDPDRLVDALTTLAVVAGGPGRVVAALGVGDGASAPENEAYGLPFPPAAARLAALAEVVGRLAAAGLTTWVGGRSAGIRAVAAAHAGALNVWNATAAEIEIEDADLRVRAGERPVAMTWGGQVLIGSDGPDVARRRSKHGEREGLVSGTIDEVAEQLMARSAAATLDWAVCAPLDVVADPPAAVANLAQVQRVLALA
jgi:hypothetical protein